MKTKLTEKQREIIDLITNEFIRQNTPEEAPCGLLDIKSIKEKAQELNAREKYVKDLRAAYEKERKDRIKSDCNLVNNELKSLGFTCEICCNNNFIVRLPNGVRDTEFEYRFQSKIDEVSRDKIPFRIYIVTDNGEYDSIKEVFSEPWFIERITQAYKELISEK